MESSSEPKTPIFRIPGSALMICLDTTDAVPKMISIQALLDSLASCADVCFANRDSAAVFDWNQTSDQG